MEKASLVEARNGKDNYKYITPYTLNAVLSSGSSQRYAVGDVIISTKPDDPTIRFGGTWQLLCPGRTMVCIDVNDSSFNSVRKTGGSKYMQSHVHDNKAVVWDDTNGLGNTWWIGVSGVKAGALQKNDDADGIVTSWMGHGNYSTGTAGEGNSQNLQPYMVVYVWEKVA